MLQFDKGNPFFWVCEATLFLGSLGWEQIVQTLA